MAVYSNWFTHDGSRLRCELGTRTWFRDHSNRLRSNIEPPPACKHHGGINSMMETRTNKKPSSHETKTKAYGSQRSSGNGLSRGFEACARPVTNGQTHSIPSVARPEGERQPIDSVHAAEGSAPARLGNATAEEIDYSVPQPFNLSEEAIEREEAKSENVSLFRSRFCT